MQLSLYYDWKHHLKPLGLGGAVKPGEQHTFKINKKTLHQLFDNRAIQCYKTFLSRVLVEAGHILGVLRKLIISSVGLGEMRHVMGILGKFVISPWRSWGNASSLSGGL